jgi:predicted nucleic acid-binding protein
MESTVERLITDCSVVAKWQLTAEPCAVQAAELLLDWQAGVVEVIAPDLLSSEIMSAFLRAFRRGRMTETEAGEATSDLIALPYLLHPTGPVAVRAFEIAVAHNQRSYDSIYVALAEREAVNLWTGDERLFNALNVQYPFVCWIGDYQRHRPGP